MLRPLVLLVALFALPAHAALIEYSFESSLYWVRPALGWNGHCFCLTEGGMPVNGSLLFDDEAPLISREDSGSVSTSIYDVSNLRVSVTFGNLDYVLTAIGDELRIVDNSLPPSFGGADRWFLTAHGDGQVVNGYYIDSMQIFFSDWTGRQPLASSELQVPNVADWSWAPGLGISIAGWLPGIYDSDAMSASILSITPTSVPEPGTVVLLLGGGMLLSVFRRRNA